jgi:hypothetical protein
MRLFLFLSWWLNKLFSSIISLFKKIILLKKKVFKFKLGGGKRRYPKPIGDTTSRSCMGLGFYFLFPLRIETGMGIPELYGVLVWEEQN